MKIRGILLAAILLAAGLGLGPAGPAGSQERMAVLPVANTGLNPRAIAIDEANNRIFVANRGSGTVTMIDGNTHTVIAERQVGSQPKGIAYHPGFNQLWVSNFFTGSVVVLSASNLDEIVTFFGFSHPHSIAINPITNRVYITNEGRIKEPLETCADLPRMHVTVLDAAAVAAGGDIDEVVVGNVQVGRNPTGVAVNPVTNRIYVTNYCDMRTVAEGGNLSVISGITNQVIDTIDITRRPGHDPVCVCSRAVAVNPETNLIYVANWLDNTVWVIRGTDHVRVAVIDVPDPLRGISNPAALFIMNYFECGCPRGVAVDPNPARPLVYISNVYTHSVSVVDGITHQILTTIPIGIEPRGIGVNPVTRRAYIASWRSHNVTAIQPIEGILL